LGCLLHKNGKQALSTNIHVFNQALADIALSSLSFLAQALEELIGI
jgi:hypothetical protein